MVTIRTGNLLETLIAVLRVVTVFLFPAAEGPYSVVRDVVTDEMEQAHSKVVRMGACPGELISE